MDTFKYPHLFVDFYHPVLFILGLVPHARTGSLCRRQCSSSFFAPFKFEQKTVIGSEAFKFLTICPFSLFVFGLFHISRPRSLLITFALKEPDDIIVFFSFHQCTVCMERPSRQNSTKNAQLEILIIHYKKVFVLEKKKFSVKYKIRCCGLRREARSVS